MGDKTGPEGSVRFNSSSQFRRWLKNNHARSDGIFLRFYKKDSGKQKLTYAAALDEALCYGWIDGQLKPLDHESWIRRFTPRRARSGWSKVNTHHVERLIAAGAMTPAGMKVVEDAKSDGRWDAAYDSPRSALPPEDLLLELSKNRRAKKHFESLNRANVYAILYRLQTAKKPETRQKRMKQILAMMDKGQKFHP